MPSTLPTEETWSVVPQIDFAAPGHQLGPCPQGMVWCRSVRCLIEEHLDGSRSVHPKMWWLQIHKPRIMTEMKHRVPIFTEINGKRFWKFVYLDEVEQRLKSRTLPEAWIPVLEEWLSPEMLEACCAAAFKAVEEQEKANERPPAICLPIEKLIDYPVIFWPYLEPLGDQVMLTVARAKTWPRIVGMWMWWTQNKDSEEFACDVEGALGYRLWKPMEVGQLAG